MKKLNPSIATVLCMRFLLVLVILAQINACRRDATP